MDPGFPGNFERVFQQYDKIVLNFDKEKPSPIEPNPSPSNPGPRDEPPWWSPEDLDKEAQRPDVPEKSFGDLQAERMAAAEQRINEHLKNPN